jgi:anti-anti-sigma regulatory factor
MSGEPLPKLLTGPQSGVYASTLGGATASSAAGQSFALSYLPIEDDGLTRIRCEGPLSLRGRPVGAEPLHDLLGPRAYAQTVLLSLDKVVGAETSGVAWLFQAGEKFAAGGGRLILFAVPPPVLSLVELLQMELPFRIVSTDADLRTVTARG